MTKATYLLPGLLAMIGAYAVSTLAADDEGVAIAIVYDTSGSMRDQVRDETGRLSPKYVIANRALENVAARMQAFASQSSSASPRNIQAGLFVFDHDQVKEAVKFGPFVADAFKHWAQKFSWPGGATPLGSAVEKAGDVVLGSSLSRKHVLVITDGVNTIGPTPAITMQQLKQKAAESKQATISVHFVAFDVNASVFSDVKRLGATVVGAGDEIQLNKQLQFILEKKILLEDEEPPKRP